MSHFTTPLGQQLANPGTGEPFSTAVVNGDLIILENGVIADRARLTTIEGWSAGRPGANGFADYKVADLAALAATSATAGDTARVTALGGCVFRCTGGTSWVQEGIAITADAATRTTEYAKAAGAYLVQGAQSKRVDAAGVVETYFVAYNSGTNPNGLGTTAGWYPPLVLGEYAIASGQIVANGSITTLTAIPAITAGQSDAVAANLWTPQAGGLLVNTPGRYAISFRGSFNATAGTRGAAQITANAEVNRASFAGDDNFLASMPGVFLPAAAVISLSTIQSSGGAATLQASVLRAIYLGRKV